MKAQIGGSIARVVADAGYRGHNAPDGYRLKVYTSGQKRNVTQAIKRDLRRRSAVEPVIGHLKADQRMDRNYLAHQSGDAVNAILGAVGYNFRLLLKWLAILCAQILDTVGYGDSLFNPSTLSLASWRAMAMTIWASARA